MKKFAKLKNRDIIAEITSEYERRGNFVRIYPARGGEIYERFFSHQKTIQRYIHQVLFGQVIIAQKPQNYQINFDGPKTSSYQ